MKQILCNKYEVLKVIAEGGMGSVYLVKDLHLNRLAAIKVAGNGMEHKNLVVLKEQIRLEAEVLKKLSHPGLPSIIDFFQENGKICLVMEYVEGITLEQYLRQFGKVELSTAIKWAIELTEVLSYLHHQNPPIIYRDLKPANIMIEPDGRIKLVDFGAAFMLRFDQDRPSYMMGTPGYSAPEQWKGESVFASADIYAFGAVLHEMITGIRLSMPSERRPLTEYDRGIPVHLEKIVKCCLKTRPSERYSSMDQLRNELLHFNKGKGLQFFIMKGRDLLGSVLCLLGLYFLVIPLWHGITVDQILTPFLVRPITLFAAALLVSNKLWRKRAWKSHIRQEKNLLLTEKKFPGIYISTFFLMLTILFLMSQKGTMKEVYAAEKHQNLFVEMRDECNRKLLIKDGYSYPVTDKISFEIPCDRLPEGEICIKVYATGDEMEIYESRDFLFENHSS